MAGVVFVFVREDASEVEILAEAFDEAGYSITGSENAELCVVVWSRRALRSETFRAVADNAFRTGRAIVAALFAPPAREDVLDAPIVDLSQWDGVETLALSPLFEAADDILHPIEASVIALPSRPVCEDAEFTEATLMITSSAPKTKATRQAWEVPLPSKVLSAVPDEPPVEPKLGAAKPRRDFRRVGARKQQGRAHAALVFAVIAILGGGAFVASVAANTASYVQNSERAKAEVSGGVSLTSATADAVGMEDLVPEAPGQIGHRGVEPPSARTVHRASYEP
ncbi:MAG: hypothetical protein NT015_14870 [Alphaproteobacteria bacterium]|nr:hypothetical protein [Alphaproteobacteria bacterium]